MGISGLIAGVIIGAGGVEFIRECFEWRKVLKPQEYPTQVNVENAEPTSMHGLLATPDLLEATIQPNAELKRIERELCKRVGAKFDSNEADKVMEAVYDGRDWDAVLDMEREHLFGTKQTNRVARWI